jgi:AAT family amino acid transporter
VFFVVIFFRRYFYKEEEMAEKEMRKAERMADGAELHRGIQPWHVSLIALGGIIGSCYFLGLGSVYADMGPGAVIIAYIIAGITIYGVMQSFAELLVNIPRRGSYVTYAKEFMGPSIATGVGWAYWANWIFYIPSEALAAGYFMNYFIKLPVPQGIADWMGSIAGLSYEDANWGFSTFIWGIVVLLLLTLINVYQVKWFGHIESVMAIAKILAIAMFAICAIGIFFGVVGTMPTGPGYDGVTGIIGTQILLAGEGTTFATLFPSESGLLIIITMMIWTLVNFQGSEIVGLSASETQDPEKNIPAACKKVAFRIILIYIIPVFLLTLVFPYAQMGLEDVYASTEEYSVFAVVMQQYGLGWAAGIFTLVTLIAAFSCANSGFYGTVRTVYGLSVEGLAPKFLSKLNKFHVPQNATIFTIIPIWIVFVIGYALDTLNLLGDSGLNFYLRLLGLSGFTGTICWVAICWSQIVFRKKLKERGYSIDTALTVKARWFPGLQYFSVIVMVAALIALFVEDQLVFIVGVLCTFLPMIAYAIAKSMGKIRTTVVIGNDEVLFDEKYPAGCLFCTTEEDKNEVEMDDKFPPKE